MSADPIKPQTEADTQYSGTDELWEAEAHLPRYNTSIAHLLTRALARDDEILEFGAGIGTLARALAEAGYRAPECLEIDADLRAVLRQRGLKAFATVHEIDRQYSAVYSSNVIEHIEDDVSALRQMRDLLVEDGRLALYVPAFPALYTDMDRTVGHYRRYQRSELIGKVRNAGFEVLTCHFADSLGFFATLAVRVLGYKGNSALGNPRSLELYDRYAFPVSKVLDTLGARWLLGKNLFLIARRC